LLIQYIRGYSPRLEAISSVRNLRTRHAVVTRDPLNMGNEVLQSWSTAFQEPNYFLFSMLFQAFIAEKSLIVVIWVVNTM
jgi:hypothetical protein